MKKALILFYITLLGLVAQGQTTVIPDTNFRKCLKEKFPFSFNSNNELIDASVAGYTGPIDCSYRKIRNLKGIEKFSSIVSLACQGNSLSDLDSIANLKNLQSIYCFNNSLTRLPKLDKLTKLNYLSCGSNKLTALPDLGNNPLIEYLDCSVNMLSSIPGLEKLLNLKTLFAHNNQITNVNGISKLTQLYWLVIGNNPMSENLPSLSALTKLSVLECWDCNLTVAPDVANMRGLYKLNLSDNALKKAPSLINNTGLKYVNLRTNQLEAVPNELSKYAIDSVLISENKLSFEDILPIVRNGFVNNFSYSPQDSITLSTLTSSIENSPFSIVAGIDKSISSTTYSWYKDGTFLKTTLTDTLSISSLQNKDSGVYTCSVRNTSAPLLTLYSRPFKVHVCFDISTLKYSTTDFDCNIGGTIRLHENTLSGPKPYSYSLVGSETGKIHYSIGNTFSNLFETSYKLEVRDNAGCRGTSIIALKGKSPEDCKGLVIIGDDYSQNNTLFLEEKGTAKVYDKAGQLVNTFSTPITWDGKNKNGEFLPGYYVIDLNGKMFNVTLIK